MTLQLEHVGGEEMPPIRYRQNIYSSAGTDIAVQLVLLFMRFVERCGTEVRDGDATARVQCEQEDQASSPLVQGVCEQLPLIERDLGQVDVTPAHTNTCTGLHIHITHAWSHVHNSMRTYRHKSKYAHMHTTTFTR